MDPSFYAQLLDAVQHSIIAVDRDEKITYWNNYATRLYGFTAAEVIGRSINDVTASPATDATRAIMDAVWAGQPWMGEYPVRHRDGASVPARVRLFPIFNAQRIVTGIIGVSEDISAELANRRALQNSQERFDLLARSTSDAVWDWEVATDTVWANAAYNELVGPRLPGQSANAAWLARVHPDDRANLQRQMAAAATSGSTFANEYRFLHHATGQYARVMDRGYFIRDAEGALIRVVGAMADISHITDIEQAFRASEERFRLVFEESPLGIVIFDSQFQIIQTNAAYRRMLGYSAQELLGRSVISITHPDDQPACARLVADLFTADQPAFRVEKRYTRRDNSLVWAAVTCALLPSRTPASPLGLALIEDITEQKRVRDELSAANVKAEAAMGAKMRFLAQVSHEIRSPMNGVLGMLELLDASPLVPEQRDNVTAARQAATSLLGMLEEILDLTRLDQQRLPLHPRQYAPARLTNEICALYRVKAAAKNVELKVQIAPGVPEYHIADPARVRQILINLLDNALKFTTNGSVQITVEPDAGMLQFTVTDTGIGIPADSLDSVFETFSAISAQTSASVGGTGLGLSISRRLARLMGGDITVNSRVGDGSRFALTLPFDSEAPPAPGALASPQPAVLSGRRILVVEDNLINQRVAVGLLRRLDCHADVADNGVEALQLALSNHYDAIIMDAMMPIMDGFETTAELRRREPDGVRVPVIGLTALATEEDRQRCLAAGMDDYIPKPTNFQALSTVLSRWLQEQPTRETLAVPPE
jgi:PAS domain S-box-containing protein